MPASIQRAMVPAGPKSAGVAERTAPTSTIVGAALIHAIWAEAGERLAARGHVPEVWGSANRDAV